MSARKDISFCVSSYICFVSARLYRDAARFVLAEVNWKLSLAGMVLYPSPLLCFTGGSILDHREPGPGVWWVCDGRIVLETGPGQSLSCTHKFPSGLALLATHPLQRQWGCQTAAGVLASWSCLGEAITFPSFSCALSRMFQQ